MPEVVVSANGDDAVSLMSRGRVRWDLSTLSVLPQMFGNADPIRFTQLLPGVQSNNEYDSGIHIYGCDNSHNVVSVNGVPIYNASHLLGLFSTFNPLHYSQMSMSKTANEASFPNRLGGQLDMESLRSSIDSVGGELSVGLISSQGTIRIPVGQHHTFVLSGRGSYLNLLYGYALKNEDSQMRYSFGDANFLWFWKPDDSNRMWVDVYWGGDKAQMIERNYNAEIKLNWGNVLAGAHWEHFMPDNSRVRHTLYFSRYRNQFTLDYPALNITAPSAIADIGYHGFWQNRAIKAGLDVAHHIITPQSPEVVGTYNLGNLGGGTESVQEVSPHMSMFFPLRNNVLLLAGIRGTMFVDANRHAFWSVDPSVSLIASKRTWDASFNMSVRHQYLFQTGFSSLGLPIEYWVPANQNCVPQWVLSLSATCGVPLPVLGLKLNAEIYFKRLNHVIEHEGTVLDVLTSNYSHDTHLLQGRGHNYGVNVSLSKSSGRVTGWVCYNIGRAWRRFIFSDSPYYFPANHERIHEFNVLASYAVNRRLTLAATIIYASGTPFTVVDNLYFYAGHVVSNYQDRNAMRLNPYFRMDLSATYKLRMRGNREQGLNVSIYNAIGHNNELFRTWRITRDRKLIYHSVTFLARILPSISYYVKF